MEIAREYIAPTNGELTVVIEQEKVRFLPKLVHGTHKDCFQDNSSFARFANGREVGIFALAALPFLNTSECLPNSADEAWRVSGQDAFVQHYLRFKKYITTFPDKEKFGNLMGSAMVSKDKEGLGIDRKIEIPDLGGWEEWEPGKNLGILVRDNSLLVPHDSYASKDKWDTNNGLALAVLEDSTIIGELVKPGYNPKRTFRPFWKVHPNKIDSPEISVPVLYGCAADRLDLYCYYDGGSRVGCAARVLE